MTKTLNTQSSILNTPVWLPYTQMQIAPTPAHVVGAEGVHLHLEDGRKIIDGISSWWSVCHGYQHPHIVNAIKQQADTLMHVMLGGLAHEQPYLLAERLAKLTGLPRVFFSDSGSTAVEVAMKMALQYWANKGDKRKNKFLAFRYGYHGDTMGVMALSDPEESFHKPFLHALPKHYVVDIPRDEYSLEEFKSLLDDAHGVLAGCIIEPLVQCAGGFKFHSPDILAEIHRLCKAHDILFIADEVATGFYRTGNRFACEEAGITPDILCLGKALTGGALGLAATLASEDIFTAFLDDSPSKALMHGPTYMGNALACTAANASLDLFEKEPRLQQVERIEAQLCAELEPYRSHTHVADVRVKGAIGVIQLSHTPEMKTIYTLRQKALEHGCFIRPFGNVIYLMPPFIMQEAELRALIQTCGVLLEML